MIPTVDTGVPFVLIGGLAVMARLAGTHRATDDLDSLGPHGTLNRGH